MMRYFFLLLFLGLKAYCQDERLETITKPCLENKASIFSYLSRLDSDTNNLFFANENSYLSLLRQTKGFPVIWLYDRHHNKVLYTKENMSCSDPTIILTSLTTSHSFVVDSINNITQLFAAVKPYNNKRDSSIADYTAVIFWVRFLGEFDNNEKMVHWEKILRKNPNITCNILKVNLDVQDSWSDENKRIYLALLTKIYETVIQRNQ